MYESFFGFTRRPFSATPQPQFYFPATSIESAKSTLLRCISRSEGPALVIGQAGTGKTLLCQLLREQFRERFRVCHLANSRLCSRRALLQAMLFELGQDYRNMEEGELRLSLIDFVSSHDQSEDGLLLLVDEAHTIPNPLLEEMRMITNLVRHGESRVRLVLAGLPQLEERFANPKLASFSQRIAARCYLDTLTRAETAQYIRFQLERAGTESEAVMDEDAMRVVHAATDGVPRLVNQLCDHALVMAAIGGRRLLDSACIQEAWTDLQQLPAPTLDADTTHSHQAANNFIEFGSLDDVDEAAHPLQESEHDGETRTSGRAAPEAPLPPQLDTPAVTGSREEYGWASTTNSSEVSPGDTQPVAPVPTDEFTPVTAHKQSNHDPFAESFQEEEVVIDRFVSLRMQSDGRPQVASREGREIANLLPDTHQSISLFTGSMDDVDSIADEPFPNDSVADRVAERLDEAENLACESPLACEEPAVVVPYEIPIAADDSHPSVNPNWPADDNNTSRQNDIGTPVDSESIPANHARDDSYPSSSPAIQVNPVQSTQDRVEVRADVYVGEKDNDPTAFRESLDTDWNDGIDVVHPSSDEVVVVEPDVDADRDAQVTTSAVSHKGRVRRLEYGQLFAKLRRG